MLRSGGFIGSVCSRREWVLSHSMHPNHTDTLAHPGAMGWPPRPVGCRKGLASANVLSLRSSVLFRAWNSPKLDNRVTVSKRSPYNDLGAGRGGRHL
jgi:hypothetical protein